jgi:hypothetical protein
MNPDELRSLVYHLLAALVQNVMDQAQALTAQLVCAAPTARATESVCAEIARANQALHSGDLAGACTYRRRPSPGGRTGRYADSALLPRRSSRPHGRPGLSATEHEARTDLDPDAYP